MYVIQCTCMLCLPAISYLCVECFAFTLYFLIPSLAFELACVYSTILFDSGFIPFQNNIFIVIWDIPRTVVVYICIGMCIWYDVFEICSPPVSTGKFSLPACSCLLPSDITQLCYNIFVYSAILIWTKSLTSANRDTGHIINSVLLPLSYYFY